jgi:hypothetical protein
MMYGNETEMKSSQSGNTAMAPRHEGCPAAAPTSRSGEKTPERAAWLDHLPEVLRKLEHLWALTPGAPLDGEEPSCSGSILKPISIITTANHGRSMDGFEQLNL